MRIAEERIVEVTAIDLAGQGIARYEGKAVFIPSTLPQEEVRVAITKKKKQYDEASLLEIIKASPDRICPPCPFYVRCGGCSWQHATPQAQLRYKQEALLGLLAHIGGVTPSVVFPPKSAKEWHYRHKARLSVRFNRSKQEVLVGFREKGSSFVTRMDSCLILPQHVSDYIPLLQETIATLDCKERIPQIEVAVGENGTVLVWRILGVLTKEDETKMVAFVDRVSSIENPLQVWIQLGGIDTAKPFYPNAFAPLFYTLPPFGLTITFSPMDFSQVNLAGNQLLVQEAVALLAPQPEERIADFFCGLGNFTLPLALSGAELWGFEGSERLVAWANKNAVENDATGSLKGRVHYQAGDLFQMTPELLVSLGHFDKWLLDPPRDGAIALVQSITAQTAPASIVYVSCNPATLARDAKILVEEKGYKLVGAGIHDMFPHTAHVESIALFEHA